MKRAVLAVAVAIGVAMVPATRATAHPLGNFTINQYSGLHVYADAVVVDVVTDEAEIPTVQARDDIDTNHDGTLDDTETASWRGNACADAAHHTELALDGRHLDVRPDAASTLTLPPGQAGLPTLRLECTLRGTASITPGTHTLTYHNTAFNGRLGWHEIVVAADNINVVTSDVATTSVTDRLTHYPTEQLRSPLQQRSATARFELTAATPRTPEPSPSPGPAAPTLLPRGLDRASRAFTNLITRRHLTVAFGLVALLIASVLGAFHALAPGHGKTVMAAYIVGERGTLRQAGLIGLTVTATHTTGVAVLGLVLTTSTVLTPERLYPWLGLTSGLLLAGIGVTLARRALRIRHTRSIAIAPRAPANHVLVTIGAHQTDHHGHGHDAHDHGHHDDHDHDHRHEHDGRGGRGADVHSHGGTTHSHPAIDPSLGWRSLIAVGFAGGLVPSPSALLVLLGAIALGRTWFGLLLVIAYGAGMAATLTMAGLLLVRARAWFDRRTLPTSPHSYRLAALGHQLPLVTSTVIILVGLTLATRAALQV